MQENSQTPKTLEIDLTGVGHFNDLFWNKPEEHFVPTKELFCFIDQKKESRNITNVILRGSGEPIFHPQFKEIIDFLIASKLKINLFTFPYLFGDYRKILGSTCSSVNFSFYIYPNSDYSKDWISHAGFLKGEDSGVFDYSPKPSLFYILDNKTTVCLDDFIFEANKRKISFNILRPLKKDRFISRALLIKAKNRFKRNNIHLNIQWEDGQNPKAVCSYFRNERMFINCRGAFSLCHFLPFADKHTLAFNELCENNLAITDFYLMVNKERQSKRETFFLKEKRFFSPCDICLATCGIN